MSDDLLRQVEALCAATSGPAVDLEPSLFLGAVLVRRQTYYRAPSARRLIEAALAPYERVLSAAGWRVQWVTVARAPALLVRAPVLEVVP